MEENINDFLGIADSSIDSIKNLNKELDLTITKLATLAEQADTLNKNLQAAGIKEVTKSMDELNVVTDKINKTNSERLNIEREIKAEGAKATKIIMSEVDAWKQVDKVLQETTISFGELSQQLVDQQYKLDKNKAKQKELRDEIKQANTDLKNGKITRSEYSTILDANNEKLADLTVSEARYRVELNKSKSDLKVLVNEQKSAEGSMDQINARLGYLRDTYRKLSQSERENADVGGVLQASINNR
jgi:chromosome segregation ATPase